MYNFRVDSNLRCGIQICKASFLLVEFYCAQFPHVDEEVSIETIVPKNLIHAYVHHIELATKNAHGYHMVTENFLVLEF